MEVTVLDELALWIKENIFDETEASPQLETVVGEQIQDEEEPDVNALSDSARLYQWCPRRKRLVQSY